jgi:hypothetical protein
VALGARRLRLRDHRKQLPQREMTAGSSLEIHERRTQRTVSLVPRLMATSPGFSMRRPASEHGLSPCEDSQR